MGKINEDFYFDRINNVFKYNFELRDNNVKFADLLDTLNEVCLNTELKASINEQLEQTKQLKLQLDASKEELYNDYQQDEEDTDYTNIHDDFLTQQTA